MSHKHYNLSYPLFASTFKKFIKNISGFFGMKPSSKSQALLQVYVHEGTLICVPHENVGKCHFFRKM